MSEVINRIILSMLNSISPTLARLYTTNYLIQMNILFWASMPITFLLFVIFGAGIGSWIPAVWITSMLIAVAQGKGHSVQMNPPLEVSHSEAQPSAPPSDPQPQGRIIDCKSCNGTGFVDTVDEPILCTRCRGHGKLRIVPKGDARIIGSGKSSSAKWQLDDKSLRLISIIVGIAIAGIGSRIPVIGPYIALGGIGIIFVGLIMFKPKAKSNV